MRILFVTRGFPSEGNPMVGNYEAVQAKAIAAKGHQVDVVAVPKVSIINFFKKRQITHRYVDGINVYEKRGYRFSTRFWDLNCIDDKLWRKQYKDVFKYYIKIHNLPDIVHAHIIFCGVPALFFKEKYNVPVIVTEHWTKTVAADIPQRLRTMSKFYHKADAVICVSQAMSDSLKRNFQVDSIVIHNMVSNLFFQSSRKGRNSNAFRFIACGAFRENRNKGFDILVDAFAFGCFPRNVYLDIIGDGPDRPFIESKIIENHLEDQIKLLGVKTPDEVSDLLCHSDCFVLSSRLETFAIVVIEALAKGIPIIATKCGGPETFVRPEDGLLVEKENVEELADAMKYMVEHSHDYNVEEIRRHCHDNFSQDVIADKIISLYKEVLNKN